VKQKLKTTIFLTTLAIAILHIVNRYIISTAIIQNLLSRSNFRRFKWRFGDIFYTKAGEGKPLLLIHNLTPCSSSYEWNGLVHQLAKNHTVYTLDLLGCGRSDKPNMTYTNFLYVQLISDFIKNVIGEETDIISSGLSSSFIIMACHNDSTMFGKIIMINPESLSKLKHAPGKYSKATKLLMDFPIVGTFIYNLLMSKNNLEYLFTEEYLYNPFRLQPKFLNTYYESAHLGNCGGRHLLSSINGLYVNIDITHALTKIDNPISIIAGKKCNNIKAITNEYLEINPKITLAFIENTKVLPQLEAPEALYQQLKLFL